MRLIDADKLKPIITEWNPYALIDERYYHEEQIINAPTVNAIPVEWMLRYLFDHPIVEYFDQMIKEWKKENESNSNS